MQLIVAIAIPDLCQHHHDHNLTIFLFFIATYHRGIGELGTYPAYKNYL